MNVTWTETGHFLTELLFFSAGGGKKTGQCLIIWRPNDRSKLFRTDLSQQFLSHLQMVELEQVTITIERREQATLFQPEVGSRTQ